MQERRKIKRRYLLYYPRVMKSPERELIGHLGDLTTDGLMIISDSGLAVGDAYELLVEVSDDVAETAYIRIKAHSVWCQPDLDPARFNVGFEIDDLTPQDEMVIERIIDKYGFRDG
jgi:hypothetical protein